MGEGGGRGASRWTFLRPSWVNGQGRKQVFFFLAVQAWEVWLLEAEAGRSPRAARRRRGGGGG